MNKNRREALLMMGGIAASLCLPKKAKATPIGAPHPISPLTANLDFAQYKAIAMSCDSGSTLPTSPSIGQWFLHTPTGRKLLLMYNGTAWTPIISLGAMTLYVGYTSSSDDQNLGYGNGDGESFATIQFAINQIPGLNSGNVVININSGTYVERLDIRGKGFTGSYTITINGTLTTLKAATTLTSAARGTGDTRSTATATGAFAGLTLTNKLAVFTKTGQTTLYRIIHSHTDDVLTLATTFISVVPDSSWAVAVYDWGTVVAPTTGIAYQQWNGQQSVVMYYMSISPGAGREAIRLENQCYMAFIYGKLSSTGNVYTARVGMLSVGGFVGSYISGSSSSTVELGTLQVTLLSYVSVSDCHIVNSGGGSGCAIFLSVISTLNFFQSTNIAGVSGTKVSYGLYAINSTLNSNSFIGTNYRVWVEEATMGMSGNFLSVLRYADNAGTRYVSCTSTTEALTGSQKD
jgi:hypothetical protein